ncbi:MAG TPA: MaoC family dehydratase [Methylovirgula sp.]|jgi:acyl dehydratase
MIAVDHMSAPPKLGEKFAPHSVGPWSMDDLRRYAAVSGDDNPIHLDPALAQRAGLPGPPVHGMLLMASFVPALALWRPDLKIVRLSNKFIRPVLVDETGEISGRVAQVIPGEPTKFLLRLMMHNERRELSMLAEALTILKPSV